jgi:hypothetical protein
MHGAGHFTWFEQPERYVDLVAGFLREGNAEIALALTGQERPFTAGHGRCGATSRPVSRIL